MSKFVGVVASLLLLVCLGGCSKGYAVAADPISGSQYYKLAQSKLSNFIDPQEQATQPVPLTAPTQADQLSGPLNSAQTSNLLGLITDDSEDYCRTFLAGMDSGEIYTDAGLNIASTVSSAVGAIVEPVGISHAFSAATAITTGTESDINTNVFQKMGIDVFAKAILATYIPDMQSYRQYLDNAESNSKVLNLGVELGRIEVIHDECSLASALDYVNSKLTPNSTSAPPASATTTAVFDLVDSGITGDESLTLIGTEASGVVLTSPPIKPSSDSESVATFANDIASKINAAFGAQNISASVEAGIGDEPTINVVSPASLGISWTSNFTGGPPNADFVQVAQPVNQGAQPPAPGNPVQPAQPAAAAPPAVQPSVPGADQNLLQAPIAHQNF